MGAVKVSSEQAPVLHQALERLCVLTGQPKPRLALSPDRAPNAFTVGRSRRQAMIVVTEGLRQRLSARQNWRPCWPTSWPTSSTATSP
jgi:heat shock protein HtpX